MTYIKRSLERFFLASRRILDGWKLLVYVRTVVVAIFDFMTGRLGRVEIATLTRPFFLLSFGVSTWHICAPEENTCTAGYAFIVFLLLLLCTFHTNPEWQDKVRVHNDRPRLESNGLYSCKWIKRKAISNFPTLTFHIFQLFHDLELPHPGQNFELWFAGLSYPVAGAPEFISRAVRYASGVGRRPTHLWWKPLLRLHRNRKPRILSLLAPKVGLSRFPGDRPGKEARKRLGFPFPSLHFFAQSSPFLFVSVAQ